MNWNHVVLLIERIQAAIKLRRFLYRWDRSYRQSIWLAASGLVIASLGVAYKWKDFGTFWRNVILVGAIVTLVVSASRLVWAWHRARTFVCHLPGREYRIRVMKDFSVPGTDSTRVPFTDLAPENSELSMGFQNVGEPEFTTNVAFRSQKFDDYLVKAAKISAKAGRDMCGRYLDSRIKRRTDQLLYFVTRVNDPTRTTDQMKIAIANPLGIPLPRIELLKVGYYDSLMTNEAYRSQVLLAAEDEDESPKVFADLTSYFPYHLTRTGDEIAYRLPAHPVPGISNHVGATTIGVTADRYPVFFKQKAVNLIGAGEIVATGSGSLDYADIENSRTPNDLLGIVRYGMARELCEEGKLFRGLRNHRETIREIAKQTKVIGFFRWVDRCGKPEFIGLTHLKLLRHEIEGDNFEVANFDFCRIMIRRLEDFKLILNEYQSRSDIPKLSLSCYMCLARLAEISGYKDSEIEEQRNIYEKVADLLGC